MVCPVSGEPSATTSFQKKLPMCSWPLGGQARRNSTEPILTNGWGFERKIAYYSLPLNEALQFLVRLFNQGLSYSALNTAHSALSAIIITEGGESFSTYRVVTRFMKGVFELRRPKPKYTKIWDVGVVLKHLSMLYPYDELALEDLTYKVLMLI